MVARQGRFAYVTLLTNDAFSPGAEALLCSLRATETRADLVVLVTSEVSARVQRVLASRSDRVVEVEAIGIPWSSSAHVQGWVDVGYTKLRVWTLVDYQRVVYVDADAVVVKSVDELFDRDVAFAAAPDVFPPDKFNAGVLVVEPSETVFAELLAAVPRLPSHDGGDTGFLNAFFHDWFDRPPEARLPFGYNAQRTLHWMTHDANPGYWAAVNPLKIIHFSSTPKPWDAPDKKGQLELVWWAFFLKAQGAPSALSEAFALLANQPRAASASGSGSGSSS